MNTLIKILKTCFFLLSLQLFSQCTGCCTEFECRYSTVVSIQVESLDNSGTSPVVPTSDTIPAKAYTLALTLFGTREECKAGIKDYLKAFQNNSYALSCPEPEFQSPDTVSSINIMCSQNFDADHPSGSILNDLFYQREYFYYPEKWAPDTRMDFLLISEPDTDLPCQFFVEVSMTNGRIFRDTTNFIVLSI